MAVGKLDREQLQERARRAKEWTTFRRDFLFSQRRLAEIVGCSRRTVVSVESGAVTPHADLLLRFHHKILHSSASQSRLLPVPEPLAGALARRHSTHR